MAKPNINKPQSDTKTTPKSGMKKKVLLLGFGDINQRLARLLDSNDTEISAVRRSPLPHTAYDLEQGIQFHQADITKVSQIEPILAKQPDQIVITIAPSNYSEQGYRDSYLKAVETLLTLCDRISIQPEVVFVSSSSVFAQNNGELVNEESESIPNRYNGKVLLEAEALLSVSPLTTTVVRFAGIYGSGRHRLIGMCLKQDVDTEQSEIHWTNRINAEDCARAIKHVLELPENTRESLYLASDNLPVERHSVYNWIRGQFNMALLSEQGQNLNMSVTGKRCDNSRLINSGFKFTYPTYKEGFIPVIAEYKATL